MKSLAIIAAIASVTMGADLPSSNVGGRWLDDDRRLDDDDNWDKRIQIDEDEEDVEYRDESEVEEAERLAAEAAAKAEQERLEAEEAERLAAEAVERAEQEHLEA